MAGEQIPAGAIPLDSPAVPVQSSEIPAGAIPLDSPATPVAASSGTIGAPPGVTAGKALDEAAKVVTDPIGLVSDALDRIQNYTQQGRAEHPVLSRVGDAINSAKELLTGGQSAGKPLGTSGGAIDLASALSAVPGAAEASDMAAARLSQAWDDIKAARSARQGRQAAVASQKAAAAYLRAQPVTPDQFDFRDATAAPVNTPVEVASPLDHATVNKIQGGKDLSPEAVKTLQQHIGGTPGKEIEVGDSGKNVMLKAVDPVQRTIKDTGIKMNDVIQKAPDFKESVKDSVFKVRDETGKMKDATFDEIIDEVRDNLPGGDEEKLNAAIDKEIQSADAALESKDPKEVLAYRRKLGSQINWNDISRNPETPGEVQNVTKVKLYKALGDKIHAEIPDTVPLDKIFQPNLELQSHLDAKLGTALSRDPVEADRVYQSELKKGKILLENRAHNEVVKKNLELAGRSTSRVSPSVQVNPSAISDVDVAIDDAVKKFNAPPQEAGALRDLLAPNTERKLLGIKTDWVGAEKKYGSLTQAERSARFSDPKAVEKIIKPLAQRQRKLDFAKKLALGGAGLVGVEAAHEYLK